MTTAGQQDTDRTGQLTPRQREIVEAMRNSSGVGRLWHSLLSGRDLFHILGGGVKVKANMNTVNSLIERGVLVQLPKSDWRYREYTLSPEYQHGESDG